MRLIEWIIGREPVATATGIAAVVTAGLGVAAAFGLDISPEQIAAIGAFAAALAGLAARPAVTPTRKLTGEEGSVPVALILLIAGAVIALSFFFGACDAMFDDEDEVDDFGLPALVADHDCWDCPPPDEYEEGDGRNDNRRAGISPGPFDRSPVEFRDVCISLDCSGRPEEGEEPA